MRAFSVRTLTLLLLSCLLQVVIFPVAGPLPVWRAAMAWFALAPFFAALLPPTRPLRALHAALLGYGTGVLWYLGTCYWIYGTMHTYGGLSPAMGVLVLVLFCLYLALYHAAFGWLLAVVRRAFGIPIALAAAPLLWVALELARARITSFPWNLLGYAQVDNSLLVHLAPFAGVYGLSFALAAVNAAIACALVLPRSRVTVLVATSAALVATVVQNAGTYVRPPFLPGTQKAILMQPNLLVGMGEQGTAASLGVEFARLTLQAAMQDERPARIALWPESPSPFETSRTDFTTSASFVARQLNAPLIAGAIGIGHAADVAVQRVDHLYNSAALFTPEQGLTSRYDKIHLVPFGEFVPYANLFSFAGGLTQQVGTFDRGTSRTPLEAEGHRYGVFLCYESIFSDEVRHFVANGAQVLVNLSDDGWYGDTSAPFQHLNMARMRAIENRRWLLRDTNSGITAAVDPNGRVVERMERHVRGAVALHFDYREDTTFYTVHGDLFAYVCTAIALLLVVTAATRRKAVD